jgi:intracellular sulfur oxidation DsrE/DsrF family protein
MKEEGELSGRELMEMCRAVEPGVLEISDHVRRQYAYVT